MSFNPDLNKQAQEVIFSRKMTKSSHPQVFFNDIPVSLSCVNFQNHFRIYLDEKLNFNHHTKEKITKAMKGIRVIKRLSKILPQHSFCPFFALFLKNRMHALTF